MVIARRCFHLATTAIFPGPTDYHAALYPPIDGLDLVLHLIEPHNDLIEHIYQLILTDLPLILLLVFLIMFRPAAMFVATFVILRAVRRASIF